MTQPMRGLLLPREALQQRESALRRMLAQVPVFLYLTDRELRFIATAGSELAGPGVELEGRLLHDVLGAGEESSLALSAHGRALRGEPARYDTLWSHRTLEVRVEPAFDEEGRCVGTIGFAVDVTGQRREEESLRTSAERLRTLLETTSDAIYLKDGEGRWLEANDAGLQLFRLPRSEYQGLTDLELSRLDDFFRDALIACYQSDQRTWAAGGPTRQEEIIPQPGGGSRIVDVAKVPLFYPNGQRKGLVVLGRDITRRRLAEEERDRLLHQEKEARAAAEEARRRSEFLSSASRMLADSLDYGATLATVARLGLPFLGEWCAVDLTGEDQRIVRVASVHVEPSKEPLARRLKECVPDLEAPGGIAEVIRTRNPRVLTAHPGEEGGLPLCDHGGSHLDAVREMGLRSVLSVPLVARGRTMGALTFISVVPDRYKDEDVMLAGDLAWRAALALDNARLYRESQEAILARDEFLSIASHELRTPITALRLGIQRLFRLARGGVEPAWKTVAASLEGVERQGRRLTLLIDSLLDVSRLQSHHIQLEMEEMDLSELVRDVVAQLGGVLARTHTPLSLRADTPVVGRWDRFRLEQVVTNLLDNAIKYGAAAPIVVTVALEEGSAVLTLRDQGIGIAPERLPFIFGRFERAVSSRNYGGLGLGLYIVRQIVEMHGGTIHVDSSPGEGSTFTVRLPRLPSSVKEDGVEP
ncbi:ATP-binding protein [Vitiosangium sp. GDMCC 1.1324]|uniref:sensor histidine kinase n=1 Tax=Vitiosangium sp. (strain GDMCC 1.1324) TaxID=2138576 RepID=UPI001E501A9A|nr:ATP-binding protein [Vitiosangium sp. GDMCC 1.1324]